jgi:protein phosphatase
MARPRDPVVPERVTGPVRDLERSRTDPDLDGMATTVAAVARVARSGEDRLVVVNVGDSRVYLFREGQLSRLSSDHSQVADLVRSGEITEEEAATHPDRHLLTSALGLGPHVAPHVAHAIPVPGDRLLLCSDGLFNELSGDEIASTLGSVSDPEVAANQLVTQAKDNGGNDNITAVVLDIQQ